ncbi:YceI family protein [Flavobacterium sp. Fl-77]|uniref:YceI family protein n=1 Tax=Flavobacterium flavipigmentatum TaxID=2893884 RepID=A0AAJ2VWU4_9FLAO|nr:MULTISPECIES: YceI family protein [unclassified Flavobacterium]MDX6180899.1 YceI family protein [Flavobacterium sp. Fl-33]MDX6184500.1 YceI family protein [Flavobacterium sp. Fl-77]UFH39607.1 YceI family protein [Flavobacterium sp. F-70]
MKKILLITMLLVSLIVFSQEKLITKTATISVEASVPSFQPVKGTNTNVTFVLNRRTGEIASLAMMKGFRFEIALMEEHFNENYMETNTYPKAVFRGQIQDFDANSLTEGYKDFIIKGKLELHGKTKDVSVNAKITKSGPRITILTDFSVNADDYGIPIPALIKYKLDNKVNIQIIAVLK